MKNIDEKYFHLDNKTKINSPEDLLASGEKALWKGKPKKSSYVLGKTIQLMPVAIIWGLIDFIIIIGLLAQGNLPAMMYFILPAFFALHLTPVWIWLGSMIKASKEMNSLQYMITNKRIIEVRGTHFLYFSTEIKLTEIENISLKISVLDKILKVGDIYITAQKSKTIVLFDIPNSEFIHERLHKLIDDSNAENTKKALFYENNHECSNCGSYFDAEKQKCPMCGAPKINQ